MQMLFSQPVQFNDGTGKLHVFSTGTVTVKQRFKTAHGGEITSKLNFMRDKAFTPQLPIWVWLVEHPEGLFLIDTGENAQVSEPGYFDKENFFLRWLNRTQFKFEVSKEEEADAWLNRLGFKPADITKVVLTHMHLDHFDGLKFFEHNDILLHDYEWKHQSFPLKSLYPSWFKPELFRLGDVDLAGFSQGKALTRAGDIVMVATPGHSAGHCAVLLKTGGIHYLLAGDITYDEQQLYDGTLAGAHQKFSDSLRSINRVKTYAKANRTVYLPSHDEGNIERIKSNNYLKIG